jgi:hypothetical protein
MCIDPWRNNSVLDYPLNHDYYYDDGGGNPEQDYRSYIDHSYRSNMDERGRRLRIMNVKWDLQQPVQKGQEGSWRHTTSNSRLVGSNNKSKTRWWQENPILRLQAKKSRLMFTKLSPRMP